MTSSQTLPVPVLLSIHLAAYSGIFLLFSQQPWNISMLLLVPLVWASVTDIQRHEIPDTASLLIAGFGLIWLFWGHRSLAIEHIATGVALAIIFLAIGEVYYRRTGADGLGMGDAKLIGGLALWVGLYGIILVILIASMSAITTLVVLRRGVDQTQGIAFGPFLCLSAWAVWLFQG